VALLHWLFFCHPEWLPRTFVDGQGLTAAKVYSEYGVIAIHLLTVLLLRRLRRPSGFNVALLLGAVAMMVLSELYFTRYVSVSDLINLLGHLYKVLAYLLLYRALFVEMITAPYRALDGARRHAQAILEAIPDRLVEFDGAGRYLQVHCRATRARNSAPSGCSAARCTRCCRPRRRAPAWKCWPRRRAAATPAAG